LKGTICISRSPCGWPDHLGLAVSFSCNPNRVTSGRHAGLVTLQAEEHCAAADRRSRPAIAREGAFVEHADRQHSFLCGARAREWAQGWPSGIRAVRAQRDLLWQLIETYAVDHLSSPLASAQKSRVRTGDREAVHFAWYGPNTAERAFGYRVIGDGFVVELGSVDPAHSICIRFITIQQRARAPRLIRFEHRFALTVDSTGLLKKGQAFHFPAAPNW